MSDNPWTPVEFVPSEATRELWARFHAFRHVRHAEDEPDEPIEPDDLVEMNMKKDDPTRVIRRLYVEADDGLAGFFWMAGSKEGAPDYESNRHLLWAGLSVRRDCRRRGVGTAGLRALLDELDARGARVLTGFASVPDGHAFAEWCGARATQVERLSRLDFEALDWAMLDTWIAELADRAPGTRLERYEDRLPEAFIEEYCPVRSALLNLMPWDDTDHGEIVVTPEDFRDWYERLEFSKGAHHTIISREPDGTISGITDVGWEPAHPEYVDQYFTGVHPSFRGRGLGKALKAAMLRFLDERYDGLKWVRTGNAATNAAMLTINERLGFREYRKYKTYQMTRDELAAFLAGRS